MGSTRQTDQALAKARESMSKHYLPELPDNVLTPEVVELFKAYSHVPEVALKDHILQIVSGRRTAEIVTCILIARAARQGVAAVPISVHWSIHFCRIWDQSDATVCQHSGENPERAKVFGRGLLYGTGYSEVGRSSVPSRTA